jgi:hypothetical protein
MGAGVYARSETVRVPAYTAYSAPDPEGVQISEESGITGWADAHRRVFWIGRIVSTGELNVAAALHLPSGQRSEFRLTWAHQATTTPGERLQAPRWIEGVTIPTVQVQGAAEPTTLSFGPVTVSAPGVYRFTLEGVTRTGATFGDVDALLLSGPAAEGARFDRIPPQRGAPSVHLSYPLPTGVQAAMFYTEVTVRTEPLWSYYMACGWHRGYFGIQVNSPTERRIIFSVWDSGKEPTDRNRVQAEDRVTLVAKGAGVFADSFGNEGTGGHSHLIYPWKKNHTYRFLVTAAPEGTHTLYSGYFYFPEKRQWGLIASFRAPKDGGYMHGLYSFDEDFSSSNGWDRRLAEFGRQWAKPPNGPWMELTDARFTHTGKDIRTDYDAGVVQDRFYLTGGGFLDGSVKYGDHLSRPASGSPPTDIVLP